MRIQNKFLRIALILIFIVLVNVLFYSKSGNSLETRSSSDQVRNYNNDLTKASAYWKHNKLGDTYFRNGDFLNAIEEYMTAIEIIENIPGETWKDVPKEQMDRINMESRVSKQIYSRYGLIEALEKAGRYEEALQNVEWLMKNQQMKGKEELLKRRLGGMKQDLLQKIQDSKSL